MLQRIVRWIIALAVRTPYFHLKHADGSYYMERYWLIGPNFTGCTVRLHVGHTADLDRALHDHPWSFVSIVLRGWYQELRPFSTEPCFHGSGHEASSYTFRRPGSVALRRCTDRHRICSVSSEGYVSLVFTGPKRHWWGFFTPKGKVYWKDFESAHNAYPEPITEERAA